MLLIITAGKICKTGQTFSMLRVYMSTGNKNSTKVA